MKFINLFVLITVSFFVQFSYAQVPTTGAYTTDEQEFFVSGNRVNESLERVNLLLCYLANTKPAEFVNKETYVATIFEDDCSFGKASKDDQQKASQARGGSSGGGVPGWPRTGSKEPLLYICKYTLKYSEPCAFLSGAALYQHSCAHTLFPAVYRGDGAAGGK